MNGSGWLNMQTSGNNLYGTLDGFTNLNFTSPINSLFFDIINGNGSATFTVNYFNQANSLLETDVFNLSGFGSSGSRGQAIGNSSNIAFVQILGNGDFAIDTIRFDTTPVPEPGSLLLVGLGMLGLFGMRARRQ